MQCPNTGLHSTGKSGALFHLLVWHTGLFPMPDTTQSSYEQAPLLLRRDYCRGCKSTLLLRLFSVHQDKISYRKQPGTDREQGNSQHILLQTWSDESWNSRSHLQQPPILLLTFTSQSWGRLPRAEGSKPVDIQIATNPRKAAILLKFSGHFKRFPNKTFQIKLFPDRNTPSPSAGIFFFFFWDNKATKSPICLKQIPLNHTFSLEVLTFTVLIYVAVLQHTNASRRYSNRKP